MSEQNKNRLEEILKGLSAEDKQALSAMLSNPSKNSVAEEALNKALNTIEERLGRTPTTTDKAALDADATGFLKSLDAKIVEMTMDVRATGEAIKALGNLVKSYESAMVEQREGFNATVSSLKAEMEELKKGLAAPIPGKAVTGNAAPVPSPNDANSEQPKQLNRGELVKSMVAKMKENPNDVATIHQLGDEINRIQAGAAPNEALLKSFNISLTA